MNTTPDGNKYQVWLVVIGVVALLWFLHATMIYTAPLGIALFFVTLAWPVERRLQKFMPAWVSKVVVGTIFTALAVAFFWAIGLIVGAMFTHITDDGTFRSHFLALRDDLVRWGMPVDGITFASLGNRLSAQLKNAASMSAVAVEIILLAYIFTLLLLGETRVFVRRMREHVVPETGNRLFSIGSKVARRYRMYVVIRTINGLLAGVLATLLCWAVGLPSPLAWGVLTWLLYYIPTLGHIGAAIPPTILAFVQFGDWVEPLIVLSGFFVLEMLVGEFIEPMMQGHEHRLAPVLVLFSVVFWGWVWGIPGAILGVPITLGLLTVLAQFEQTRWIAVALGGVGDDDDDDDVD